MTLPARLASHLLASVVETRAPAWIECDKAGVVRAIGGPHDSYGLGHLAVGAPLVEQVAFFEAMFATDEAAAVLPLVEFRPGVYADVHVFVDRDADWLVLLDSAGIGNEEARRQQTRNEILLALEGRGAGSAALLSALEVLVLERHGVDDFSCVGVPPGWCDRVVPEASRFALTRVSTFLESFLVDAEEFWHTERVGSLASGPWSERLADVDRCLEATATRLTNGAALLLISPVESTLIEKQQIVQRARDLALEQEARSREAEKKEILLHCIVHDLRSPLTSVVASLKMLEQDLPEADAARFVRLGLQAGKRQERLIRNMLSWFAEDLEGLETWRAAKDAGPFVVASVRAVLDEFRPAFILRRVDFALHRAPELDTDVRIAGDGLRFQRVVANLLDNALRHSFTGALEEASEHIAVAVLREGDFVRVAVENRGERIDVDIRQHLFERHFTTVGGSGASNSGLGLYYCRMTVESWGGTIDYEYDERLRKNRFAFRLPVLGAEDSAGGLASR